MRGGMAEIIKRWLRDKVGLDPHQLADSDRAFANGFLFGKLFDGYGVQPDFDKFVNKEAPDAKLANFQRLQPTIRSLNIKFDAHVANQLMTEEPGAAMMLLQQLKVVLDVEPGPGTGGGSRTQTGRSGRSRGSTSLLLTTNRLASKAPYKQMEEQTFFNTLRLKSADPREFRLQNHLRPFEQVAPISPRPTTPPACPPTTITTRRHADACGRPTAPNENRHSVGMKEVTGWAARGRQEAVRQLQEAERDAALAAMAKEQALGRERDLLRTKLAENRAYMQDWDRQGRVNHAKNQVGRAATHATSWNERLTHESCFSPNTWDASHLTCAHPTQSHRMLPT